MCGVSFELNLMSALVSDLSRLSAKASILSPTQDSWRQKLHIYLAGYMVIVASLVEIALRLSFGKEWCLAHYKTTTCEVRTDDMCCIIFRRGRGYEQYWSISNRNLPHSRFYYFTSYCGYAHNPQRTRFEL